MEDKRRLKESNRSKRAKPSIDDSYWDCSVCTYRNSAEAFKCDMCDIRKGTSTRKPRLNAQVVAQQVAQQYVPPLVKEKPKLKKEKNEQVKKSKHPRLKNIDRTSGQSMEVTVNNITVVITDYKPKRQSSNGSQEGTSQGQLGDDSSSNRSSPEKDDGNLNSSDSFT